MPMTNIFGIPSPTPGDATNVPGDMQAQGTAVGRRSVPNFASEAARNAALPAAETGQAASVGSDLTVKHADRWGRIVTDRTGMASMTMSTPPVYTMAPDGSGDFVVGSFNQAAGVRLKVDVFTIWTCAHANGGVPPIARVLLTQGVSGGSWTAVAGPGTGYAGPCSTVFNASGHGKSTIGGTFYVTAPATAISRSLRVSAWLYGGNASGQRLDEIRCEISPTYAVTSF